MKKNAKQSIIAGGLITSAGVFVAKFIGLFYAIPYNTLLDNTAYVAIYGNVFQIYNYLLNISLAGFPFAIATMVAKYYSFEDIKTTLLVKKLSLGIMASIGLIMMLGLLLFATPLAKLTLPSTIDESYLFANKNGLMLLSAALFLVPILSSYRGYYQGLKHMEVYALSQVLEQVVRVCFLLGASALLVYVFDMDNVFSLYMGVLSTSVSAIVAIIHLVIHDRKYSAEMRIRALSQTIEPLEERLVLKELCLLAFPYLLSAILGYSDSLINTTFLPNGLPAHGYSADETMTILSVINYGGLKLASIPMILAPGFSTAIIPYLTTAIAQNNKKLVAKYIRDCIDNVLYIAIPICVCMMIFALPIYYVMFPPADLNDLALCGSVMQWYAIDAFFNTVAPIFGSLMMAGGMMKQKLKNLCVFVLVKVVITYPMMYFFGYQGAFMASYISLGVSICLDAYYLSTRYHVKWKYTIRKFILMLISCLGIFVLAFVFDLLGMNQADGTRTMAFLQLALTGILSIAIYLGVSFALQLPQTIFKR